MSECPLDGRPTRNATVCNECGEQLARDLGDVAGYVEQLELSLSRQTASGARNGGRSAVKPLPYDVGASEVLGQLRSVLVGWVRVLAEQEPDQAFGPVCRFCLHLSCSRIKREPMPADTLPAMAAWLLLRRNDLMQHEAAQDVVEEIGDALKSARRAVDRRAPRVYAGTCGAQVLVAGPWSDAEGLHYPDASNDTRTCAEPLYGHPGRENVVCRACGTEHDVEKRKAQMLADLDDRLCTASEIAMLSTYLGDITDRPRTRKLLNKWAERGLLVPHSVDHGGRELYRFGDALSRLLDTHRKAG